MKVRQKGKKMRELNNYELEGIWGAGGPAGLNGLSGMSGISAVGDSVTDGGTTIGLTGANESGVALSISTATGSMSVTQNSSNNDTISMTVSNDSMTCGIVGNVDGISASCNDGSAVSCDANGDSCSVGTNGGDW